MREIDRRYKQINSVLKMVLCRLIELEEEGKEIVFDDCKMLLVDSENFKKIIEIFKDLPK